MNIFKLLRDWFDWCFENPEKINPNHTALYVFAIEHCNRLGWKVKFGLPTTMAKEAIGIKSYNTYKKTLDDLVEFGFIEMIEKSKNQYSSNIVALSNFDKALDKALDKASVKHMTKQSESTHQSISSIDIHNTNNQETILQIKDNTGVSDFKISDSSISSQPELKTEKEEKEKSSAKKEKEIPAWEDFEAEGLKLEPNVNLVSLKAKFQSWVDNGWKDGHDNKIKNWRLKIANTIGYLPKVNPQFQKPQILSSFDQKQKAYDEVMEYFKNELDATRG